MTETADFQRYALYYAPPSGSGLARLGAAWLGIDPETGAECTPEPDFEPAVLRALPLPHETLVRKARVYGFHATLKAPFRLAEDIDRPTFEEAIAAFAARTAPVVAPRLALRGDMGFVALRPSAPCPALDALAAACVTKFDVMRAPLTAAEIARRRRGGLDTLEDRYLREWGYPYVLERFRFHMTLSSALSRAEAHQVAEALYPIFEPHLDSPFRIDEVCLFGDPGEGHPFRLLRRYPLTGAD